jgi:hypothetical protein
MDGSKGPIANRRYAGDDSRLSAQRPAHQCPIVSIRLLICPRQIVIGASVSYPASSIQHPASSIQHPASNILALAWPGLPSFALPDQVGRERMGVVRRGCGVVRCLMWRFPFMHTCVLASGSLSCSNASAIRSGDGEISCIAEGLWSTIRCH